MNNTPAHHQNPGDLPGQLPTAAANAHYLDILEENLTLARDQHLDLWRDFGDRADLGYVRACQLALSMLHITTHGEFGQPLEDQPDPAAANETAVA